MPIPGGGFNVPPRPPTLEEIIKIFGIAKNFEFSHNFDNDNIRCSFTVTKEDCLKEGLSVSLFASVFLAETKEHLAHLWFFEQLVKKYADPNSGGSTAADCIAFLRNELKHMIFTHNLEGRMRKGFFETIIKKLEELAEWRTFADNARFERMRREHEAEETIRRAAEYMKAQAEKNWQKQRQEKKDRHGGPFESSFDDLHEAFRRASSSFGFKEQQSDYNDFMNKRRRKEDRVRPSGTWHEILGVPLDASKATIKSAWRKLAKRHHPDRAGGDAAKMAEINAAKDEGLSGASS